MRSLYSLLTSIAVRRDLRTLGRQAAVALVVVALISAGFVPLSAQSAYAKTPARTAVSQVCTPAPALSDPNPVPDSFDALNTSVWNYDPGYTQAPSLECGDNVLKNIGYPDAIWRSKLFYTLPLVNGNTATVQFKLDSLNSKANFAIENGSDGVANRFGIEADLGRIYVKIFTGTFTFPGALISPTKLNTWYELALTVNDAQGFQISLRDTQSGATASYTHTMPAGLEWNFSHYVLEGNAYLDNYYQSNSPAAIAPIGAQTLLEDKSSGAIPLRIGNVADPNAPLTLTVASDNPQLFPAAGIELAGSGLQRTLTITPSANQSGSAVITLSLSSDIATTLRPISVTVLPVNDPPAISKINYIQGRTLIPGGTPLGPLPFTVGDIDNPLATLTVTASASDPRIVPPSGIIITGTDANRAITVIPDFSYGGAVTMTVTVSDGLSTANTRFTFVSTPRRFLPLIDSPPLPTPPPCNTLPVDCFEPNNGFTTATPITIPAALSATVYGTEDQRDYYAITLQAGERYVFDLTFSTGDLDLYLYADSNRLTPAAESARFNTSSEQITYTPTVTGKYYVLVFNYMPNGQTTPELRPYSLSFAKSQ